MPLRDHDIFVNRHLLKAFPQFATATKKQSVALAAFEAARSVAIARSNQTTAQRFGTSSPSAQLITHSSNIYNLHVKTSNINNPLSELDIVLPKTLLDLEPLEWIRIAFLPGSENFYHYLNQTINNAIKIQADKNTYFPDDTDEEFYAYLNSLDTKELNEALNEGKDHILSPLYLRLVNFLYENNYPTTTLACTDGKPVNFIASLYLGVLLNKITASDEPNYKQLQELAAFNGCFITAEKISSHYTQLIKHSVCIKEAQEHYDCYINQYNQNLMDSYYSAGILLAIKLQKQLVFFIANAIPKENSYLLSLQNLPTNGPVDFDTLYIGLQNDNLIIRTRMNDNNQIFSKNKCINILGEQKTLTIFLFLEKNDIESLKPYKKYLIRLLGNILINYDKAKDNILKAQYLTLSVARQYEFTNKNALRLNLKADNCYSYILALYDKEKDKYKINTITDVLILLKNIFPTLGESFKMLDERCPSPKNSHYKTIEKKANNRSSF